MLEKITSLDKEIKKGTFFYSLSPFKVRPTLPSELAKASLNKIAKKERKDFLENLSALYISQFENFPLNIFWDLDHLISHLVSLKNSEERFDFSIKIQFLNEIYGIKNLNFSYTHDFIYGFDWQRWVQKDYKNRKNSKPFGDVFLDYLIKRSEELRNLIEQNDKKYPKLKKDEARNPFNFSRDPENEIKLHLQLAEKNLIPLKSWEEKKDLFEVKRIYYNEKREEIAQRKCAPSTLK